VEMILLVSDNDGRWRGKRAGAEFRNFPSASKLTQGQSEGYFSVSGQNLQLWHEEQMGSVLIERLEIRIRNLENMSPEAQESSALHLDSMNPG
jgi:hypothetical protein